MSKERVLEIKEQLFQLEGKIRPLQWDFDKKQINPFKSKVLKELALKRETLQKELAEMQNE